MYVCTTKSNGSLKDTITRIICYLKKIYFEDFLGGISGRYSPELKIPTTGAQNLQRAESGVVGGTRSVYLMN